MRRYVVPTTCALLLGQIAVGGDFTIVNYNDDPIDVCYWHPMSERDGTIASGWYTIKSGESHKHNYTGNEIWVHIRSKQGVRTEWIVQKGDFPIVNSAFGVKATDKPGMKKFEWGDQIKFRDGQQIPEGWEMGKFNLFKGGKIDVR